MSESTESSSIKVTLPDGSVREVPRGTTPFAIAHSISPRLAEAVVVAKIRTTAGDPTADGAEQQTDDAHRGAGTEESMYAEAATAERIVDLAEPLNEDVQLWLLKESDPEALRVVRHSAAHVMATAITELYPDVKLGHGPATDVGFFYDILREKPFTPDDLIAIETKMAEVVARNEPFRHEYISHEEALRGYGQQGDFMKVHFIEKFTKPGDNVSFYRNGEFLDFCRGPHVPTTGRVRAFKVMSIAGAYWLGDEKNPQLQRIYGTAFYQKKELDAHFKHLEEIKARDHRVLGKQLDLFSIQELAGSGLIFWHPKGSLIRKEMENWMREECLRRGYQLVYTPHIMKRELWKVSGHEEVYADNMYPPMELDDAEYRLKPMNCPGHILIYKNSPKSYRDLPQRYAEFGNVYRYERSGTMHGLLRVRGFTQDDAHIFCTREQIVSEVEGCHRLRRSGDEEFRFRGIPRGIVDAQARQSGLHRHTGRVGRERRRTERRAHQARPHLPDLPRRSSVLRPQDRHQAGRCPGPFVAALHRAVRLQAAAPLRPGVHRRRRRKAPARHGASRPVRLHRTLLRRADRALRRSLPAMARAGADRPGTHQRKAHAYAQKVKAELEAVGLRVELDARNEKMNAKIREFGLQKVPFILIMGDKEAEANAVSVRARAKGDEGSVPLADFIERARALIESRSATL